MLHKDWSADGMKCSSDQVAPQESEAEELIGGLDLRSGSMGSPAGHSDRVALYSVAIGSRLDMSPTDLNLLKMAAMLHDIGKVGISPRIVDKLGKLNEREFEIMRLHSTIAVRMLERVEELKDCIPLIKHHHERFDGKGYPDGLSGHDIPLGSRIIAVAETFDMLVSDVPWRDALTLEEAIKELQASEGTQLDPLMVDTFVDLLSKNQVKLPDSLTIMGDSGPKKSIN